jgi:hypothetical protein
MEVFIHIRMISQIIIEAHLDENQQKQVNYIAIEFKGEEGEKEGAESYRHCRHFDHDLNLLNFIFKKINKIMKSF